MRISKVRIVKTLKAGRQVWVGGSILTRPIPAPVLGEIRNRTGTVEVIEGNGFTDAEGNINPSNVTSTPGQLPKAKKPPDPKDLPKGTEVEADLDSELSKSKKSPALRRGLLRR